MRRFDAERVHQPDGVGRHVTERVRRGDRLAEQLLLDQRRQIRDRELLHLRRQADVAIVEPNHPKTSICELCAECLVPGDHLRRQTHDQHQGH